MTLPYRETKFLGFEHFLHNTGIVFLMIYLFMSGLAYRIMVTIQNGDHLIFLLGGAFILFVALVLRDYRRFSAISEDEVKAYYNKPHKS
jgi:hypothetical protein